VGVFGLGFYILCLFLKRALIGIKIDCLYFIDVENLSARKKINE
jgi:hypothetical protein